MKESYIEMAPLWYSVCPHCEHMRYTKTGHMDKKDVIITCRKCGEKYIEVWER